MVGSQLEYLRFLIRCTTVCKKVIKNMKIGIVGLPNVGKSTIFNSLTKAGAMSANYPFCTVDPNIGVVSVPDKRLDRLQEIFNSEKVTPATIEFVDIAGLVKGASKGEGLGNKFLANIREVDAICHVVRCFEGDNIIHVEGGVDPKRDIEIINLELILSDLESMQKRLLRVQKSLKGDPSLKKEEGLCQRVISALENGNFASCVDVTKDEKKVLESYQLLTSKPVIYVANVSERDIANGKVTSKNYDLVKSIAQNENAEIIPICAEFEAEISVMSIDEKKEFLAEMGLTCSGLEKVISSCYKILALISFLTAGKPESRAWTIKKGTKAPQAAGKIHSDLERGFIRAEVIGFDALSECASMTVAKEKGLVRSEGKDYIMQDGDVVLFRFNV